MNKIEALYRYLPTNKINWPLIETEILKPFGSSLAKINQEPKWHGEDDVLTHTKMVSEELIRLDEYQKLNKQEQLLVFLAALFHDIGKITCTKVVDGEITSKGHALKGSVRLREYLWKEIGLSGTKEYQAFREALCLLVRYHSAPVWEPNDKTTKKIIEISLNQELTPLFKISLLAVLSKADHLGRISSTKDNNLENLKTFIKMAKELDCYDKPFKFSNSYTKKEYFLKDNIWPYETLYDSSFKEVILLCGLPGTGKDTFIKNNYPKMPVISLDDIRAELGIKPTDEQGKVISLATARAKEFLRNKTSFIWNATNLTNLVRNKLLRIFHDYNAKVKIIFLETSYENNLNRNNHRSKEVSVSVIDKFLANINMPQNHEAMEVEWIIV